jgi:hypothetical protein
MPTDSHQTPRNAFTHDFLTRLDQAGEPDSAREADVTGPWAVRPVAYRGGTGFGLLREWESVEQGDVPYAVFRRREMALLAAAVLPASGREPLFRLRKQPDALGFELDAVDRAGTHPTSAADGADAADLTAAAAAPSTATGHVREFDEDFAAALHVAAAIVRSPLALARLLEAAGFVAVEQVGRILHRRIR